MKEETDIMNMREKICSLMLIFVIAGFLACTEKVIPTVSSIKYDFEDNIDGWKAIGNISISQDRNKQHNGKASMKITGTGKAGSWSFVESEPINIVPGKHYKVNGWILIDSISSDSSYLKVVIWKDGKWLKNIDRNLYDLNKIKQWQKLEADFVAPEDNNLSVSFTIEKRPMEKEVEATIYVDDITLNKID